MDIFYKIIYNKEENFAKEKMLLKWWNLEKSQRKDVFEMVESREKPKKDAFEMVKSREKPKERRFWHGGLRDMP